MAVMLEAEQLGYGYPGKPVGCDVSFTLAAGEVLAVLGPNGGGKTTLFRTLLGLLPVQSGRLQVSGRRLDAWSRNELARLVGYVPQGHAAQFAFSVLEVVLMGRTSHVGLFAAPGPRDRQAADAALAELGIEHLAGRVYTQLSGGERQLALIARALAQGARMLVLDEPTSGLDFGNQTRVLREVVKLARLGIAVLFSTHDPDQAFQCATSVLMIAGGTAHAQGSPAEVITAENLKAVYGIDVRVADLAGHRVCLPVI